MSERTGLAGSLALIVDDHELMRSGLRLMLRDVLGFQQVIEAGDLDHALAAMPPDATPDLVTLDLTHPGRSGIEGLAAAVDAFPTSRIVVISASEKPAVVLTALGAGACGYIPKSLSNPEIAEALARILSGEVFVPFTLSQGHGAESEEHETDGPDLHAAQMSFTRRQLDVLRALMLGSSNKRIAKALNIAEGTVKIHLANIFRIMGVRSRAEVIARLKKPGDT